MKNQNESTYALLVRSEEKGRGVLETALYALCILRVVASIWQFAQQPVNVPAAGFQPSTDLAAHMAETGARS